MNLQELKIKQEELEIQKRNALENFNNARANLNAIEGAYNFVTLWISDEEKKLHELKKES